MASLPDLDVVAEAAIHERVLYRPDAVLALTVFDDNSIFAAMRAGVRGYVLKGAEQ